MIGISVNKIISGTNNHEGKKQDNEVEVLTMSVEISLTMVVGTKK